MGCTALLSREGRQVYVEVFGTWTGKLDGDGVDGKLVVRSIDCSGKRKRAHDDVCVCTLKVRALDVKVEVRGDSECVKASSRLDACRRRGKRGWRRFDEHERLAMGVKVTTTVYCPAPSVHGPING